jgi:predicted lactoylglutathione lyase
VTLTASAANTYSWPSWRSTEAPACWPDSASRRKWSTRNWTAVPAERSATAAKVTDIFRHEGQMLCIVGPGWQSDGMEQRISLVTLGVSDISRSFDFYKRLGWHGQEVEETVFFQTGGIGVVLWHQDKLADDAGVEQVSGSAFRGVAIAHNVRTKDEVDLVIATAVAAGASITRPPADTFYGGYAAYFADPDGHVWEIAYNPGFLIGGDGALTIPDFGDQ